MKTTLEYVISAPAQGFCPLNKNLTEAHLDEYKRGTLALTKIVKDNIAERCKNYTPKLSCLFNAYTEARLLPTIARFGNFGLKTFYADSGGLQIVTAGREMTEELKREIYKTQTFADYALCFDVIPLSRVEGSKRTRNERSNNSNKIYNTSDLLASGLATGQNIKDQIATFRKMKASTKVIIIVQGNCCEDMVTFYKQIASVLEEKDYEHISGIAVADTCIGNGEAESIEMIRAAKHIAEFAHPNVRNHLHILGVGSIKRMAPFVYLKRSGYLLDNFKHISYDSSSHTSTFTYGLLKLDGHCVAIGNHRTTRSIAHFKNVYDMFESYLKEYATKKEFLDFILGPEELPHWQEVKISHSDIKIRAMGSNDNSHIILGHLIKTLHVCFQIENFIINLDKLWTDELTHEPMRQLLRVSNEEKMTEWMTKYAGSKQIKSKRIKRRNELSTLEGFFG